MNVWYEGKALFVGNRKADFARDIHEIEICGDIVVVQLDYHEPNNIYGVDNHARIIWQVQDAGEVFGFNNNDTYVGIFKIDDNYIRGITFNGLNYDITVSNGNIIKQGISK